jgi:hypothetical protein
MRKVVAAGESAVRQQAASIRRRVALAKRRIPPGAFEILGSFDAGQPEPVLFMNPIYRGLMNLLLLETWAGETADQWQRPKGREKQATVKASRC